MAKKKPNAVDPRLSRLISICESLPGSNHESYYDHHVFRAGKKTIAYFLNNHHGDGIISVCCKSTRPRQAELIAESPKQFYLPAYLAYQGWIGLRLDLKSVNWEEVASLMLAAYRLQATKKLLALLENER